MANSNPIIFLHGTSVRPPYPQISSARIQTELNNRGVDRTVIPFDYGRGTGRLRFVGESIPGFNHLDKLTEAGLAGPRESLTTTLDLLIGDPMAELEFYRAATPPPAQLPAIQDRRATFDAMRSTLPERILSLFPDLSLDQEWISDQVNNVFDIAMDMEPSVTVVKAIPILSRSLGTLIAIKAVRNGLDADQKKSIEVVQISIQTIIGDRLGLGEALNNFALSGVTALLRHNRSALMPPVIGFMCDILYYLTHRDEILSELNAFIVKNRCTHPTLIGHSLGGIIAYDYAITFPSQINLITVGSQVGLLAEADLVKTIKPDLPVTDGVPTKFVVPDTLNWINIYDLNDMLSFLCMPIFTRVNDFEFSSGRPFPASHNAYFENSKVYDQIRHSVGA